MQMARSILAILQEPTSLGIAMPALSDCRAMMCSIFAAPMNMDCRSPSARKQLAESPVSIQPPDINASLAAVRSARAAREKR